MTWALAWELLRFPLIVAGAWAAKRLTDQIYRSDMRHTVAGFTLLYASWLAYGALAIAIWCL